MGETSSQLPQPRYCPALSEDYWIRHLLFPNEWPKTNKLHPKFLENLLKKFQPPRHERPWFMKISGRLLSKADDIVEFAKNRAIELKHHNPQNPAEFRGIIYQQVGVVRAIEKDTYDVFHEPSLQDAAHANLVRLKEYPEIKGEMSHAVIRELVEKLQWVKVDSPELKVLLEKRRITNFPTK